MSDPAQSNPAPAPSQPSAPAAVPQVNSMGEVLILGTACGHRLDKIMGESDHWKVTRRLIDAGLLTETGDPTPTGSVALEDFFKRRTEARRKALAEAEANRIAKLSKS